MHEKSPKEAQFESHREYKQAYYEWLCRECPEVASSVIGKMIKSALKANPDKWNSESASAKKD